MKMFAKVFCLVFTLSVMLSGETFAKRSVSHEQRLEKKSLRIAARSKGKKKHSTVRHRPHHTATRKTPISRRVEKKSLPINKRTRVIKKQIRPSRFKHTLPENKKARPSKNRPAKRTSKQSVKRVEDSSFGSSSYFSSSSTINYIGGKNKGNNKEINELLACSGTKGVANIDGVLIKGNKVKVTPQENGSVILDVDGVRKVIRPFRALKNMASTTTTLKDHNGRTTHERTSEIHSYTFITTDNKNLPREVQKDVEDERIEKMITKMNEVTINEMNKDFKK